MSRNVGDSVKNAREVRNVTNMVSGCIALPWDVASHMLILVAKFEGGAAPSVGFAGMGTEGGFHESASTNRQVSVKICLLALY